MGFRGLGRRAFHLPDLAELALQTERVDGPQWQRGKDGNALVEHAIGILECERDFGRCALRFRWIRNAPMGGSRMSRPHGACFCRRAIADREHEVELRFTGLGEVVPRFRAITGRIVAQVLEKMDGVGVNLPLWLAACVVGAKMSRAYLVQDR